MLQLYLLLLASNPNIYKNAKRKRKGWLGKQIDYYEWLFFG